MRQDLILFFKIFMNALIYAKCVGSLDLRPQTYSPALA
jgi:hypothetical protein